MWRCLFHFLALLLLFIFALRASAESESAQRSDRRTDLTDPTNAVNATTKVKSVELAGDNCAKQTFNLAFLPSSEAYLKTPKLITKYGYPVEKHVVTTKDGYILTLFRIPYGRLNTKTDENFPAAAAVANGSNRPVVFLQHGIMCSSADWLMQPGDNSFPFMLANAGYDVWLGNARGTSYSNKHSRLNSAQLKYWRFSWHEMGKFDIPAVIDYILERTNEPKLYYIGHSMGGTIFFVAMSLHPEYNDKIRSMYGLGPGSYLEHMGTPFLMFEPLVKPLHMIYNMIGFGKFTPPMVLPLAHTFAPLLCAPSPIGLGICGMIMFMACGFDPCQLNSTRQISKILGHLPDTTSFNAANHYFQLRLSGKFRAYDHGEKKNARVYGQISPPDYDLSKVTAKVAVFWGDNDLIVRRQDVIRLIRELPNVIADHRVDFDLWNHLDFTYGIDAKPLVYDEVMRLMAKSY